MRPDQRPIYHFLHIASHLGAEWLFDAARAYWNAFRPTVLPDFTFLRFVPADQTITVTVIALRDRITTLGVELAQVAPTALLDAVVFDTFEQAREELNRRAAEQQPFGVPIATPTLLMPLIPTPRLPATRPPNGYVTVTPPPGTARPPTPTPPLIFPDSTPATPDPAFIVQPVPVVPADEPQPIRRTPGPVTDGNAPPGGG